MSCPSRPLLLAGCLVSLAGAGCTGPRLVETRVDNRPATNLRAVAEKVGEAWRVEMNLPAGTWTVTSEEAQPVRIIPGEPAGTLTWEVSPDRWANKAKPFVFQLGSPSGQKIYLSVKYVRTYEPGTKAALWSVQELLCVARWF